MSGLLDWLLGDKDGASTPEEVHGSVPPPVTAETIGDLPWELRPGSVVDVDHPDIPTMVIGENFFRGDPDGIYQRVSSDGAGWDEGAPEIPPEDKVFLQSVLISRERGG